MRDHSKMLAEVLAGGSFNRRILVDVFHGTDRVLRDLGVDSYSLTWDYGEIGFRGSLSVAHGSEDGSSLIPVGPVGVLSPFFGASVLLLMEVTAGGFSETVQLGWARITGFSDARDTYTTFDGVPRVVSTQLKLELQGVEVGVARRGFRFPSQPPARATCYEEIRRLTGLPCVESLPDKLAPSMTYEAEQGGRWKAALALGTHLGGSLYVDPSGVLVVHRPDPPRSGVLSTGQHGTITDFANEAGTDTAYNEVVGLFEDAAGNPLYEVASIVDGPMGTDSPYGTHTRYYSSDFVKTRDAARSAVAAILTQATSGQTYDVPVSCVLNPLVEPGDRWRVVSDARTVEGTVLSVQVTDASVMNLVLEVRREW